MEEKKGRGTISIYKCVIIFYKLNRNTYIMSGSDDEVLDIPDEVLDDFADVHVIPVCLIVLRPKNLLSFYFYLLS